MIRIQPVPKVGEYYAITELGEKNNHFSKGIIGVVIRIGEDWTSLRVIKGNNHRNNGTLVGWLTRRFTHDNWFKKLPEGIQLDIL